MYYYWFPCWTTSDIEMLYINFFVIFFVVYLDLWVAGANFTPNPGAVSLQKRLNTPTSANHLYV